MFNPFLSRKICEGKNKTTRIFFFFVGLKLISDAKRPKKSDRLDSTFSVGLNHETRRFISLHLLV